MKVGLYPICGDILHSGHISAMREAKENCDYLIVALNCTPDGKTPVQSIFERFNQLSAVKYADEIIPYGGFLDLDLLIRSIKYDVRFLGSDYMFKEWDGKEFELQEHKEIYFIKRSHGLSSTELKERISWAKRI